MYYLLQPYFFFCIFDQLFSYSGNHPVLRFTDDNGCAPIDERAGSAAGRLDQRHPNYRGTSRV